MLSLSMWMITKNSYFSSRSMILLISSRSFSDNPFRRIAVSRILSCTSTNSQANLPVIEYRTPSVYKPLNPVSPFIIRLYVDNDTSSLLAISRCDILSWVLVFSRFSTNSRPNLSSFICLSM